MEQGTSNSDISGAQLDQGQDVCTSLIDEELEEIQKDGAEEFIRNARIPRLKGKLFEKKWFTAVTIVAVLNIGLAIYLQLTEPTPGAPITASEQATLSGKEELALQKFANELAKIMNNETLSETEKIEVMQAMVPPEIGLTGEQWFPEQ